jgi:hypothetical protein
VAEYALRNPNIDRNKVHSSVNLKREHVTLKKIKRVKEVRNCGKEFCW